MLTSQTYSYIFTMKIKKNNYEALNEIQAATAFFFFNYYLFIFSFFFSLEKWYFSQGCCWCVTFSLTCMRLFPFLCQHFILKYLIIFKYFAFIMFAHKLLLTHLKFHGVLEFRFLKNCKSKQLITNYKANILLHQVILQIHK